MIKEGMINEFFLTGMFHEIQRLGVDICVHEKEIVMKKNEGETDDKIRKRSITKVSLLDVFRVINPDNYPVTWNSTLEVLSMFPTTVSCEQYFSRMRNEIHENMTKETSFALLLMSQKDTSLFLNEKREMDKKKGFGNPTGIKGDQTGQTHEVASSSTQQSPPAVVQELGRQDPMIQAEVQSPGNVPHLVFKSKRWCELDKLTVLVFFVFVDRRSKGKG